MLVLLWMVNAKVNGWLMPKIFCVFNCMLIAGISCAGSSFTHFVQLKAESGPSMPSALARLVHLYLQM